MKDLYRTICLLLLLLLPQPCFVLAAQDVSALRQEVRVQAQQAAEAANVAKERALRNIQSSIQQIQQENQARIQQLTQEVEAFSEQTRQQALSIKGQTGKNVQVAGKESSANTDPYDSEEAQEKAEAALLRTGPTGPKLVPIFSTADPVIVSSDDIVALKSQTLDNAGTLKADVLSLDEAISNLGARVTKMAIIVDLQSDILFDFDKDAIKPAAEHALAQVALIIRKKGTGNVRIDGHTDAKGSKAYNQKLSERRADAVKKWLVKQGGIRDDRLITAGFGETKPVAPNTMPDGSDNPEGRALNRRVVITITSIQ